MHTHFAAETIGLEVYINTDSMEIISEFHAVCYAKSADYIQVDCLQLYYPYAVSR